MAALAASMARPQVVKCNSAIRRHWIRPAIPTATRGDLIGVVLTATAVKGDDLEEGDDHERYVAADLDREWHYIVGETEADEFGTERCDVGDEHGGQGVENPTSTHRSLPDMGGFVCADEPLAFSRPSQHFRIDLDDVEGVVPASGADGAGDDDRWCGGAENGGGAGDDFGGDGRRDGHS